MSYALNAGEPTAVTPSRLTLIVVGVLDALLFTVTEQFAGALVVGCTHTCMLVLPPAGMECAVRVVSTLKGAVPQPVMLLIVMVPQPVLLMFTVLQVV